ncbi:MAG: helix-turn-helix domain-containing protein [Treponema sp.]|jgi:transcriptional regulator with XRE-family HTH domain|nr:helix-turn-helix domain-containing protein [Treponema sp.]
MILSYLVNVDKLLDLRKILSQNIRNARLSLHISQAKLAEYAEISVPHMVDIEYCKTWVSDKTLASIARALNMPPHELLIPPQKEQPARTGRQGKALKQTAELINAKKKLLRKQAGEAMDNLILEIVRTYGE